jgi:uncharacterized membrane protein
MSMTPEPAPVDQTKRLIAAMAYPIWVIAVIIVLTDQKNDAFMRRHGWLALFWAIGWVIVFFGWSLVAALPLLHWLFLFHPLLWPAFIISSFYYAFQTYNGREFTIPIVSDWARKYTS